ncbi:MAG TPA: DUF1223 domain-containing protein, partial [Pyrinomonadaceae bacterium]|nr:DUF1223 domain-containing protein [Pyrinomonadaceae bacterium]
YNNFMKSVFYIFTLILILSSTISAQPFESRKSSSSSKQPVLLELFTSQGCIRCPPANRNLAFFEKEQPFADVEIITLALHVDYWDNPQWKDEFSSRLFTRRQEIYSMQFKLDGTFTPQMVVDGETHFVGSNLEEAKKAIAKAAKKEKPQVELNLIEDKLKIKIPNLPKHAVSTLFLAITESNLKSKGSGGNSVKLLEHGSIVRELRSLGWVQPQDESIEMETFLQLQPDWKRENLKFVVFVQENYSRKILTVSRM